MDNISLERINTLHPKLRDKAKKDYLDANNLLGKNVRLRISYAKRSFAEQAALYAQGRETLGEINRLRHIAKMQPIGFSESRNKVTNAKAGESYHNYALAFDIVLLYDKNSDGIFEEASWDLKRDGDRDGIADWIEVTKLFTERGWVNGFWTNGKHWDKPHFQYTFGLTIKQLQAKYNHADFISNDYVKI
ncbi:MAG TPA: M15 family metallopeptidase [Saprospiraceae bacterium]|jgi:peptidoglycan L-alanyl-D-glutamate endopeptidase CwlK|nr:M15 family metallopeptidase [Saprospiraceae bacterium]